MFGYACFNDGSYRDCQRKASQWTIGKNFDASGGFGPCLVTADELVMGMPGGVGYARTPPVWMKAGDTIDITEAAAQTFQGHSAHAR